jgi:hypothetical protein
MNFDEILIHSKEELINKLETFSEAKRIGLVNYYKEKLNI